MNSQIAFLVKKPVDKKRTYDMKLLSLVSAAFIGRDNRIFSPEGFASGFAEWLSMPLIEYQSECGISFKIGCLKFYIKYEHGKPLLTVNDYASCLNGLGIDTRLYLEVKLSGTLTYESLYFFIKRKVRELQLESSVSLVFKDGNYYRKNSGYMLTLSAKSPGVYSVLVVDSNKRCIDSANLFEVSRVADAIAGFEVDILDMSPKERLKELEHSHDVILKVEALSSKTFRVISMSDIEKCPTYEILHIVKSGNAPTSISIRDLVTGEISDATSGTSDMVALTKSIQYGLCPF